VNGRPPARCAASTSRVCSRDDPGRLGRLA
jgi:hypothetical protein